MEHGGCRMREGRFRMIDLGMEEKTQIRQEVPESPIGYYLLDLEDNINYPLKDGWHFDISKNGEILTYFTIRFNDEQITIHTEIDSLFINYVNHADFSDDITEDAVIEFKDGKDKDQFVLSKDRNLTVNAAKKIIGRYLVMSTEKGKKERLQIYEKNLEELTDKLEEVNLFFNNKRQLEETLENLPEKIEEKKRELESLEKLLDSGQEEFESQFSASEVEKHASLRDELEMEIKNVNSQIAKIKK